MKAVKGIAVGLAVLFLATGCVDQKAHSRAVYMMIDTSGTYAAQVVKAQRIVNYLLGTLNPGDSLAVARVKSRSFSEKDIIYKATFEKIPSKATAQKRAFRAAVDEFARSLKKTGGSAYTDITGGLIQAAEFLTETGSGEKTVIIFSDMQEEIGKGTVRDFPIELSGIRIVALNVTKLRTDNVDPRRYLGRLQTWEKRVMAAGAKKWKVVNDWENHPERIFED
ncbi:MAG: hypothetical protein LJE56_08180 [Acidiferrobacterales bacterium]|jgi:hypothetical protein|nr:hypothetical protein [Acidiferrobacterales bacterium]